MQPPDTVLLQKTNPPYAKDKALRMAARGCAWLGDAFIGISFLLLCHVRQPKSAGASDAGREGPLLPFPGSGDGIQMREQIIHYRCPGCLRVVKIMLQIEGLLRCEDCEQIVKDKENHWVNARNN